MSMYGYFSDFRRLFDLLSDLNGVAKFKLIVFSLNNVLSTASLSTEHMNLVRKASSSGSSIEEKSQVAAS